MGISKKKSKILSISEYENIEEPTPLSGRDVKRLFTKFERKIKRELRKNPRLRMAYVTVKYKKRVKAPDHLSGDYICAVNDAVWIVCGVHIFRESLDIHRPVFHHSRTVPRGWRRAHADVKQMKDTWCVTLKGRLAGLEDI